MRPNWFIARAYVIYLNIFEYYKKSVPSACYVTKAVTGRIDITIISTLS